MISVHVSGMDAVVRNLRNSAKNVEDALDEGCQDAADYLVDQIIDKFGTYQPGWATLKPDTIRRKIRKGNAGNANSPLVDYGDMMFSFNTKISNRSRKHTVTITSDDPKLPYHMYGVPSSNVPKRDPVRPTLKKEHDKCIDIVVNTVRRLMGIV